MPSLKSKPISHGNKPSNDTKTTSETLNVIIIYFTKSTVAKQLHLAVLANTRKFEEQIRLFHLQRAAISQEFNNPNNDLIYQEI